MLTFWPARGPATSNAPNNSHTKGFIAASGTRIAELYCRVSLSSMCELARCERLRQSARGGELHRNLLPLSAALPSRRFFLYQSKLDFLFHGIDSIDNHPNALSKPENFSTTLANDFFGIFPIGVTIVRQTIERHQAFHKQVG